MSVKKTLARKGFASAMVIVSLLGVSCAGFYAGAASRLTDAAFGQARQERARFLEEENLKGIGRIKKLPALSDEKGGFSGAPRDVIGEVIHQFPDFEEMRRLEEILYISFLHYGLQESPPFSELEAEKSFSEGIKALMKPYLPQWGEDDGHKALVPVEKVEKVEENARPDTARWFFAPSLRFLIFLIESSANEPMPEQIFRALLYSEFYLGIGKEKSRAVWEALRRLETSNTGRDSLGMYQGGSVF